MKNAVIVSACRTAIGKFQGQFRDVSARDLAVTAGKEAIRRAGIDIKTIEEIVMGECYPHMQGSLPARQVSMRIGLDESSNAVTVNQNCASGMRALEIACSNIQLGNRIGHRNGKYDTSTFYADQGEDGIPHGQHSDRRDCRADRQSHP